MNTPSLTAAEVREGDIILSRLHGYRPYEVGSFEVRTLRWNLRRPGTPPSKVDERIFTWRPVGCAKFYRGLCFDATDGILLVTEAK